MGTDDVYSQHRETIDRVIAVVCRRHRLRPQDADEFASHFLEHLVENDYAVLRRFSGRSSLRTYLIAVTIHAYQDWRNAQWGKWRPCAEAKRLGPVAILLDTLIVRDGHSFDEAYELIRTNHGVTESRPLLELWVSRFPSRSRPKPVAETELAGLPAADAGPERTLARREESEAAGRAGAMLMASVAKLAPQDRLILKMRFDDDLSIAEIARLLQLDQVSLYPRMKHVLTSLRADLETMGMTPAIAAGVLRGCGFDDVEAPDRVAPATLVSIGPQASGRSSTQTARTP